MVVAAFYAGIAVAGQERLNLPCAERDKACISQAVTQHPVRRLAFWQPVRDQALEARVAPAPQPLVEYLNMDNLQGGFPDRPRSAQPDAAFMDDIRAAIRELPPEVQALFKQRLLGVYLVEDLGGTGYTDVVFDDNDRPVAGFIVLDSKLLQLQTANAWASWKENTPFKWQSEILLKAQLELPANDNRKNAIQYILLHELGHVLSIGGNLHPPWTSMGTKAAPKLDYPYFNLSWRQLDDRGNYASLFDPKFPLRQQVVYYFGAKLSADQMMETYNQLEATNFSSLYGATRPGDDFAEAFASYVHVVLLKRPWQITISRQGAVLKVFNACWGTSRCATKQALIEDLLRSRQP